jgi:hypothetical protein
MTGKVNIFCVSDIIESDVIEHPRDIFARLPAGTELTSTNSTAPVRWLKLGDNFWVRTGVNGVTSTRRHLSPSRVHEYQITAVPE